MSSPLPSFWRGLAAGTFFFEDLADYSRWACDLLKKGHDGPSIRVLAGLDEEVNLFVLREWHCKALKDLGRELPPRSVAFDYIMRGLAEDHLLGSIDVSEILNTFNELYMDHRDSKLNPFQTLYHAWYHYDEAEWDLGPRANIPNMLRDRCQDLIRTLQVEEE